MNLTIHISDEDIAVLKAKASFQGMSAEQYALQVLKMDLAPEWLRKSWETAKQIGVDHLTAGEIDAEIGHARKARFLKHFADNR